MIFFQICEFAKQHHSKALTNLIESHQLSTMNLYDADGIHTPLSLLAQQGHISAVHWLLNFLENFNGKLDFDEKQVVIGFAMGNHDDALKEYLSTQKIQIGVMCGGLSTFLPEIIYGHAMAGHHDQVHTLLSQHPHPALQKAAIHGYKIVGNYEQSEYLEHTSVHVPCILKAKGSFFYSKEHYGFGFGLKPY